MLHWVLRAGVSLGLIGLLPSCYGTPIPAVRQAGPAALAVNFFSGDTRDDRTVRQRPALLVGQRSEDRVSVLVRGFHEPGDWGHRNYCGAGATQVLLSVWLPQVPDIESVARRARLNPSIGQSGTDTTAAINSFIDPIVQPTLGRSWYRGEHVTALPELQARLRSDLLSPEAIRLFGHGVPLMVQVMTKTMPGWHGWNATHMITIYGVDFGHNDPRLDSVSYAETPSPLAGYRGPDFQTMSLAALWTAMQAFLVESPSDPINLIW